MPFGEGVVDGPVEIAVGVDEQAGGDTRKAEANGIHRRPEETGEQVARAGPGPQSRGRCRGRDQTRVRPASS